MCFYSRDDAYGRTSRCSGRFQILLPRPNRLQRERQATHKHTNTQVQQRPHPRHLQQRRHHPLQYTKPNQGFSNQNQRFRLSTKQHHTRPPPQRNLQKRPRQRERRRQLPTNHKQQRHRQRNRNRHLQPNQTKGKHLKTMQTRPRNRRIPTNNRRPSRHNNKRQGVRRRHRRPNKRPPRTNLRQQRRPPRIHPRKPQTRRSPTQLSSQIQLYQRRSTRRKTLFRR